MKRNQNSLPIGVFDSGVGGLTVVREILRQIPNENVVYFGDTARVPYGTKSASTITHFAMQDSRFLLSRKVKMIVVACNTVSSNSMKVLRKNLSVPLIDVLKPNAELAALTTQNNRIGIIGTPATIESGSYEKVISKYNPSARVFTLATPLLVPLAEQGWTNREATNLILNEYLQKLLKKNIDTLILGCTHYPLFEREIKRICTKRVKVINSARETAMSVKQMLVDGGIVNNGKRKGDISFFLSDIPRNFPSITKRFLNYNIKNDFKQIDIEKY